MDKFVALACLVLAGCRDMPPMTIAAGFFGASVSVTTPDWSKSRLVRVEKSALIESPVLMVPPGEQTVNEQTTAKVSGSQSVPVIEAPVSAPVLAVPKQ